MDPAIKCTYLDRDAAVTCIGPTLLLLMGKHKPDVFYGVHPGSPSIPYQRSGKSSTSLFVLE